MELQVISSQKTVQAQQISSGNTVNFSWSHQEGERPQAISFNAQRGEKGGESFTGNNVIYGAFYPETEKFDVQNNNFQPGDFDLYNDILSTCKNILADNTEE